MTPRHAWTPAELQQLRDHYPTTPTRQLAHQMSLPIKKVYAQAMRLGLRKSAEFMATSDKTGRILRGGKLLIKPDDVARIEELLRLRG